MTSVPSSIKADGAVLELTGRVRLRVDIADLLELEAAFQADGVIDAAADEEDVVGAGVLGSKPLDALLVLQTPFRSFRESSGARRYTGHNPLRMTVPLSHRRTAPQGSTPAISWALYALVVATGDLRAGDSIEDVVRFPGNRAADHVDDAEGLSARSLWRGRECCEAVRRFAPTG